MSILISLPLAPVLCPLPFSHEANGFQVLPGYNAFCCAGVDQEEPFPGRAEFYRVPYGHGHLAWFHFRPSQPPS